MPSSHSPQFKIQAGRPVLCRALRLQCHDRLLRTASSNFRFIFEDVQPRSSACVVNHPRLLLAQELVEHRWEQPAIGAGHFLFERHRRGFPVFGHGFVAATGSESSLNRTKSPLSSLLRGVRRGSSRIAIGLGSVRNRWWRDRARIAEEHGQDHAQDEDGHAEDLLLGTVLDHWHTQYQWRENRRSFSSLTS